MSGGALAAKRYLINSTKQINPKVLKALKGNVGPWGPPRDFGERRRPQERRSCRERRENR
jgi:hypothetical protein